MAAHREALRCAASASSLPFAAVNDDVPAALLRAATAGLMQRSDAPYDVSFSSADVELSMQLHLLDEAEGGARVLYGTVQNAASLPDGLEEEMLRDLRADAAVHDAQMTPFTLFRSTQTRSPSPPVDDSQDARCEGTKLDVSVSRELSDAGIASDSADADCQTPGRGSAASSRKRKTPCTQRSGSSGEHRASGSAKKTRVRRSTSPAPAVSAAAPAALAKVPDVVAADAKDDPDPYRYSEKQDMRLKRLVDKYRLKSVTGDDIVCPTGKSMNGIPWTYINRAILAGECPELRVRVCNAASHVLSKRWWILCPADCPNRERKMH